ncbi:MAG TPA: branched-chain amino acid ABC transporter permease [Roseiflexaceae bacterium]|jgi:branched-chain amino acid transport system permease protein|nr:branched-chain amino acid ABC transporter permease [Roseiflexaceae bacterium]
MNTTEHTTPPERLTWRERIDGILRQGYTAHIVAVAYVLLACVWFVANPFSTLAFIFFLAALLLIYYLPIPLWLQLVLGLVVLGVTMPYIGNQNQGFLDVVTQAAIFIALALGLNIVVGFAGLLDLGYIAFFAIGAYLWAIFSTPQIVGIFPSLAGVFPLGGWWFFVFIILGVIASGIAGVVLGLPVLRLRGDYLAIVTLGFGEVIRLLANNLNRPVNITGGAQGITSIGQPPLFFQPVLDAVNFKASPGGEYRIYFYVLALLIVFVTIMVARRLSNSRIGRAWTAVREDETAAIAMGVPLVRMKLLAFACGASFAGTMGVLFAAKQQFISPPTFDVLQSISILAMVILGGMGSIPGAILGATLITLLNLRLLPDFANQLQIWRQQGLPIPGNFDPVQYQRLLFGLVLILMTIFRPEGFLPEQRRRSELHAKESEELGEEVDDVNMVHPDVGIK